MIDFSFTEEQEMYRAAVRRFAREEVAPRRREWDRERKYPWPLVHRFVELELGDPEMDNVTRGILTEEISYADFNCADAMLRTTLPFALDYLPGVPEDVAKPYTEGLRLGQKLIAYCFTEPGGGSDMAAFTTNAIKDGDEWVVNGCKNSISWANADAYVVTCHTAGKEAGVWALSNIFIPATTPGVSPPQIWDDIGTRGTPRGVVYFDDVRVPLNYMVGEEGRGYQLVAELFDTNRAFIGLKCIGPAQASVDEACEYAKQRTAMGRPLASFQAISFTLAEAQTILEAARLLCYKTLWVADRGERHTVHGAMCKWWVPEVTMEIVRKCLLIHGHYGYTTDLPFEQRMRDILGWQIGDGTAEVSKLIVARSMIGRDLVG